MADPKIPFLLPVLRGRRFDEATVPVDVLAEFAQYREIVVEVAKAIFRERQPHRQRVPKKFADSFQLSLERVDPGSAVPVLVRNEPSDLSRLWPDLPDLFDDARDLVAAAIGAVARDAELPRRFPRNVLPLFNKFGRALHEDETMELRSPSEASGVRYGQAQRKRLVLLSEASYEGFAQILGTVTGLDRVNRTFLFNMEDGPRVPGSYEQSRESDLLDALCELGPIVIEVFGQFGRDNRLEKILDIHDAWSLEADPGVQVRTRVDELLGLKSGWLDGDGEALDRDLANRVASLLTSVVTTGVIGVPRIYPTPEGGLEAEWSVHGWEIAVTFTPSARVELSALHAALGAEHEEALDLSRAEEKNGAAMVAILARFEGDVP